MVKPDRTVTIKARKWVVTNSRDEVTAIEGDGVVGEFPVLRPGEKYATEMVYRFGVG